ncbi:MAG: hypothetical protein ACXVJK_05235, partial [Candidatus Aminicenantales bacterium]
TNSRTLAPSLSGLQVNASRGIRRNPRERAGPVHRSPIALATLAAACLAACSSAPKPQSPAPAVSPAAEVKEEK